MQDKLAKVLSMCACGFSLEINQHRNVYQSPQDWLSEHDSFGDAKDISDEVRAGIVRTGNIVEIHFYPDTPVGFYQIFHYDLEAALDEALNCLGQDR